MRVLIISCGNATPILESAKHAFDEIAALVKLGVADAWLSLASMQGDKAHGLRDDLRERLTTEQLAEARALARRLAARIEAGQ